jgi:hypothetical protein
LALFGTAPAEAAAPGIACGPAPAIRAEIGSVVRLGARDARDAAMTNFQTGSKAPPC